MKILVILSILMGSLAAQASRIEDGGSAGNGGHPIGLEFLRMAVKIIADIRKEPQKFPEVKNDDLEAIIRDRNLKVLVSKKELWVVDDEGRTISVPAKNLPSAKRVEIHEASWMTLSREAKLGLVFHEVLGLAGLERTGEYHISRRYKEKPDGGLTEAIISRQPFPLIPAKAVSCYQDKITPANQTPDLDVDSDYFRIPMISFFRSNTKKDLIIANIRITYAIPASGNGSPWVGACEISGDRLRALSASWWKGGPEAVIPASGGGQGGDIFSTDCAVYCGGNEALSSNFTTTGDVEIFGLERDPNTGDESPIKMTRTISIQNF